MSRPLDVALAARNRQRIRYLPLLLGAVLAVGSIVLAIERLEFKTSRQDLLNPHSEFHHRWLEFADEFGANSDAVVVIEGAEPQQVRAAIDAIGQALRADPERFQDVLDRFDAERLVSKGLYYVPDELLDAIEQYVTRAVPLIRDPHVMLTNLAALPDLRPADKMHASGPPGTRHARARCSSYRCLAITAPPAIPQLLAGTARATRTCPDPTRAAHGRVRARRRAISCP